MRKSCTGLHKSRFARGVKSVFWPVSLGWGIDLSALCYSDLDEWYTQWNFRFPFFPERMLFEIKKIHSPINRIIIILSCNYESVSSLTRKYIFIARSDLDSCLNGIRNDLLVVVGHESNFALITYRAHFHPLISTRRGYRGWTNIVNKRYAWAGFRRRHRGGTSLVELIRWN